MEGAYYVCSSNDAPEIIYFSEDDAFSSGYEFIDVFDEDGEKLTSYKLDIEGEYVGESNKEEYTTDF